MSDFQVSFITGALVYLKGGVSEPPSWSQNPQILTPAECLAQEGYDPGTNALVLDSTLDFSELSFKNSATTDPDQWLNSPGEWTLITQLYKPSSDTAQDYILLKVYDSQDFDESVTIKSAGSSDDNLHMRYYSAGQTVVDVDFDVVIPRDQWVTVLISVSVSGSLPYGNTMRVDLLDVDGNAIDSHGVNDVIVMPSQWSGYGVTLGNDTFALLKMAFQGVELTNTLQTAVDHYGEQIIVNFTTAGNEPVGTYATFNDVTDYTAGEKVANLVNSSGQPTGISFSIEAGYVPSTTPQTDGYAVQGEHHLEYCSEPVVLEHGIKGSNGVEMRFTYAPLDPTAVYDFIPATSRAGGDLPTTFTVNGDSRVVSNQWNNKTSTIFAGLTGLSSLTVSVLGDGNESRVNAFSLVKRTAGAGLSMPADQSINVAENETAVATIVASGGVPPYSYALTGVDAASLAVGASSGSITFITAPNFEQPADDGQDNTYLVTTVVTDDNGDSASTNLTINITDVPEQGTVSFDIETGDPAAPAKFSGSFDYVILTSDGSTVVATGTATADGIVATDVAPANVNLGSQYYICALAPAGNIRGELQVAS